MKKILMAAMAVMAMSGCKSDEGEKVLVLYYSQTGTTKAVAEVIAEKMGADIEAIEAVEPYSGSFMETVLRGQKEMAAGVLPELKPLSVNVEDYDVVFLGYPVWFGTYALPVKTLLKDIDLSGKKVVPFCTFGSGGLDETVAELRGELEGAEVMEGYGVRTARVSAAPDEVARFLISEGFMEGVLEVLPEFSEQVEVSEAEKEIFEEACGDYQFPLGTPVTFGSRETSYGTEYLFNVESVGQDGAAAQSKIYVIVDLEGKAEFTKVVR